LTFIIKKAILRTMDNNATYYAKVIVGLATYATYYADVAADIAAEVEAEIAAEAAREKALNEACERHYGCGD
jgi:hypothetical protein